MGINPPSLNLFQFLEKIVFWVLSSLTHINVVSLIADIRRRSAFRKHDLFSVRTREEETAA